VDQHLHSRSLSWRNLYLGSPDIAIALDRMVFNVGERVQRLLADLPP
jgi:hypothetical protein